MRVGGAAAAAAAESAAAAAAELAEAEESFTTSKQVRCVLSSNPVIFSVGAMDTMVTIMKNDFLCFRGRMTFSLSLVSKSHTCGPPKLLACFAT